ncbi:LptF/LptG family permease [Holophaga foetida]|uniref:LptF/LptG family permease n=1 Tax=Holophaga foetida TaxID=35839 RepID=UPI0002473ABD|nr:LptF/LptG family permease [Holophaga foetida]
MLPILPRYFLRRWLTPFAGALVFYLGLMLAYELMFISRQLFHMGAPFRWVFPMVALSIPEDLSMVLPMAAVLGGLLGTQHMAEGSELVASNGLGIGMRHLIKPWAFISIGVVVLSLVNSNLLVPKVSKWQAALKSSIQEEARTRWLAPGSAPWNPPGAPQSSIWMSPTGQVHLMEVSPDSVQHLVANHVTRLDTPVQSELSDMGLRLEEVNGVVYSRKDHNIIHINQKTQNLIISSPKNFRPLPPTPLRYEGTGVLLAHLTPEGWIELSRRITLPIAVAALLLLGIALGIAHPRFPGSGSIPKSLGVILAYYFIMRTTEDLFVNRSIRAPALLFLVPLLFLGAGFYLLRQRMTPHHSNGPWERLKYRISTLFASLMQRASRWAPHLPHLMAHHAAQNSSGILHKWSRSVWLKNWAGTLLTFLGLGLLIDFASLAGDLSKNHVSILVFLHYWLWNLSPFLVLVLPIAFLLGSVLAISEACASREWNALKSGGVSFVQWFLSAWKAWGLVLAGTLILQVVVAPIANQKATALLQQITKKVKKRGAATSWLYLGGTGIHWYMDGQVRWGFPLEREPGGSLLLRWRLKTQQSEQVDAEGLKMEPGPEAVDLFPSQALRQYAKAEEASTLALFQWQRWAPSPDRATLLWGRFLQWLAGPCLVFAILSLSFPAPRKGRGQALGIGLVAGLLFFAVQTLFSMVAQAGDIPPLWGAAAPMLLALGIGFLRLRRVRT